MHLELLSGFKIFVDHTFDGVDMDIYNLISFTGIFVIIGFAHLASMAIFVGGVSALAPDKTRNIAAVALRALAAATLACLMTTCVAGTFFTQGKESILLGD